MTGTPDDSLREEPQSERGPKGSRDTGSDHPSGGPADRPAGKASKEADTSMDPREPTEPDAPDLQSGGS